MWPAIVQQRVEALHIMQDMASKAVERNGLERNNLTHLTPHTRGQQQCMKNQLCPGSRMSGKARQSMADQLKWLLLVVEQLH